VRHRGPLRVLRGSPRVRDAKHVGFDRLPDFNKPWVPEGSLAGFLGVRFWGLAGPRGPGKPSKTWGALRTGQTSKTQPKKPARLPADTQSYGRGRGSGNKMN
jgi:hypothetical protein